MSYAAVGIQDLMYDILLAVLKKLNQLVWIQYPHN